MGSGLYSRSGWQKDWNFDSLVSFIEGLKKKRHRLTTYIFRVWNWSFADHLLVFLLIHEEDSMVFFLSISWCRPPWGWNPGLILKILFNKQLITPLQWQHCPLTVKDTFSSNVNTPRISSYERDFNDRQSNKRTGLARWLNKTQDALLSLEICLWSLTTEAWRPSGMDGKRTKCAQLRH